MPDLSNFLTIFGGIKIFCKERLYMTEKICYTIERYVSGISLAGTTKYAPVAQLDRALDSDSKGRWFESSRAYQDVLMKDATPKTPHESAAFLYLYRLFSGGKVRKNASFGKSVFPRERQHFRDAAERSYGLV